MDPVETLIMYAQIVLIISTGPVNLRYKMKVVWFNIKLIVHRIYTDFKKEVTISKNDHAPTHVICPAETRI